MPKPRKTLISLGTTPYYHCVSGCVRPAFLCGTDEPSGNCYEYRRQWVEDKPSELAGIFSLDIAAYAIMSNHYHVVLYIDQEQAERWSQHEVVQRWHRHYRGNALSQRFVRGQTLHSAERKKLDDVIESWRERLMSISQFMHALNEFIAREANYEDQCIGRFWEGRFKYQALLDEAALAACMVYVDLNPIRAKMANTPEESDHTSAKLRIEKAKTVHIANHPRQQPKALMPFAGNPRQDMPHGRTKNRRDFSKVFLEVGVRAIASSRH